LTTGPFTSSGFVGNLPLLGPGSTVVADGQIGAAGGPQNVTVKESVNTPDDTKSV
jgi:hypothetical protein